MSRLVMVGVVVGMFVFAAPAYAGGEPPPCDPKTEKCDVDVDCSPGYWKNHVEVWCPDIGGTASGTGGALVCAPITNLGCGGDACSCEELRHLTSAEEGATEFQRRSAQGCLNEFFSLIAGFSPCGDD